MQRLLRLKVNCQEVESLAGAVETSCRLGVCLLLLVHCWYLILPSADRAPFPREEVPLPSQPPFTAFVGNLAFDLTEDELGAFFGPHEVYTLRYQF